MVMSFFASPKGKNKKAAVVVADDISLDSVSLNDGMMNKGGNNKSPSNSNHDSYDSGELYKYHFPGDNNNKSSERSIGSFQENGGTNHPIDSKLLKEERHLQKIIAKSKDKPLDKKAQKATDKRREAILKEKVKAVTVMEQDLINRCLAVDEDGYCLRHTDQKVRMRVVKPLFRFETISICKSCAFGATSGIEMKNHGQKDNTIAHAVNGALVAAGVKTKKKKVKGSFAANMNGASPRNSKVSRVDLNDSFRDNNNNNNDDNNARDKDEFASSNALQTPSMSEHRNGGGGISPNHTSSDSRTEMEQDARWMEEVQVRVLQVHSWDNSTAPLKCHPNYAKYFRMLETGIPVEEIKEMNGEDGPDLLALSLDPEKSLNDQMTSLPPHIQERLRSNPALITAKNFHDDESETVEMIYKSYLAQLHVFEHFLQQDEEGINAMRRDSNGLNGSVSEVSAMTPEASPMKKKKKLRLTKKIKRFVGVTGAHKELSTDDEGSDEENIELSEASNSNHMDENPVVAQQKLAVGPVALQPLPTAGLRRARRPTAANRKPRKPGAKSLDRGVVQAPKNEGTTPMSPLSPSPGRGGRKHYDSKKMDNIMSTSSADELVEEAESKANDAVVSVPTTEQSDPPVVVVSRSISSAPSDEDMGELPTTETAVKEEEKEKEEEKVASPGPPMVIKSFPSAAKSENEAPTDANNNKKTEEATPPPVMVIKSFPSRANKAPQNLAKEEKKETAAAPPLVIKSFPSAKRASNTSNKKEDEKAIDPWLPKLGGNGKQDENEEAAKEAERQKKEELRKAVETMHQFKLGSYDDSFGSIPTTVLPDLCPTTGEPSIHSHLSSISSHSSDASSSYESESESDSDSDSDDDEDDGQELVKLPEEEESEKETIDMDEYIHLSDKLIDANAELFEAKYLLSNSQKREETLLQANKAKDRQISKLSETIEEMQSYINVLSAQNAEAGKIMMELTATIEDHKRQKLFRRISIASMSMDSLGDLEDTPLSQHKRSSGPIRRTSEDTLKSYGSNHRLSSGSNHMRRASGSGHNRFSGSQHNRFSGLGSFLGPAAEAVEEDLGENSTPMMIAVTSAPATPSNVGQVATNMREVPPSAASNVLEVPPSAVSNVREVPPSVASNVREVPPTTSEPVAAENPALEDNMFPPAANVREITPLNRKRIKEVSAEEGQKQITAAPIVPAAAPAPSQPLVIRSHQGSGRRSTQPTEKRTSSASERLEERRKRRESGENAAASLAATPAPSRPLVIRSYQPSERLAERRRRKRELEERLKQSVAKSHSTDDDDEILVSKE
eukprot:CAMPEP_0113655072 /NCGR_PEP_ID=MMETSP0017_2-20120614/29498_1 /TAXON_ID=2856 /ORGANISM="Cylindrotheca closterium" /LENGTH=1299 /DNA_ID=CAMNT_0000568269 /DNA_START=356 /DNA_END=4255 /DNA_ORIENTATION=- /assembly_acc=CAM_ASM_000147